MNEFEVGDLIKRKWIVYRTKGTCLIVSKDDNSYTIYNNSMKYTSCFAKSVIHKLYERVVDDGS